MGRNGDRSRLNEFGHDYDRTAKDAAPLDGVAIAEVNSMLARRLEAKFARDYESADAIKEALRFKHGVTVDDGRKQWRADGASFAPVYGRIGDLSSEAAARVDEARVASLTKERMAARKSQDYARADDILDELLDDYGVVLVDQDYTWRYVGRGHDGVYGEGGSYGRRADEAKPGAMGTHDYVREQPTGEVVECDEATQARIDGLLAQRLALKKARNAPSSQPEP